MANLIQLKDEEESPNVTLKGYNEIVAGSADMAKSPVRMTAGGYSMPNRSIGANPQDRTPALIVQDDEFSGGITTLNQALYSRTDEGMEEFNQARQTATRLQEAANLPNSYRVSPKSQMAKNFVGDLVAGASEAVTTTLAGFADGRYLNAIKESASENKWKEELHKAYAQDKTLQQKMENLYYRMDAADGGQLVSLEDMSMDDLSWAQMDRWVNADGSPLSDTQKDLLDKYRTLNEIRVADREYRQYTMHFGREMADYFGLHKTTQADFDTIEYMLGRGAGDVAGSGLIYGYGGAVLSRFAAGGALKLAPRIMAAERQQYIKKAMDAAKAVTGQKGANFTAQEVESIMFGAKESAKAQYLAHTKMTIPMNTLRAGMTGGKFAFTTSFFRQYYDVRNEALMKGMTFDAANWAGFLAGMGEGLLEGVKFNLATKRFLSEDPGLWNFLMYEIVPEGLQEGTQQTWENIVTQSTGVTDKEYKDIASEVLLATAMGALGGVAFGSIHYKMNSVAAAEEAIQDRYRRQADKTALDYDAWGAAAGTAQDEGNLKELPFNGMPGENGFTMKPGQEDGADWSEAVRKSKEAKPQEGQEGQVIKGTAQAPVNQRPMLQLGFEEEITLPDGSKSRKASAIKYKEDGTDAEGHSRFITGEIQDPVTGETVGVMGVVVDPQTGKKIGDYKRITRVSRPYVKDANAAQEMANAEERVLEKAKKLYKVRVKQVNPKITDEQIEKGWRGVRRAAQHELRTQDFSKSVFNYVAKAVDAESNNTERFRANIEAFKGRLGQGLSAEDIERLQSDDYMVRYQAQWDIVKRGIVRMFAENGMAADGEEVANAFEAMFQDMLLIDSNLDPIDFYQIVKPKVLSFARAQANGQKVQGMHSLFDDVTNRVEQLTPQQAYDVALNLVAEFELYKNAGSEKERKKHELNIKQTLFGAKQRDYKVDDIETAIEGKADIEEIAAWNMGLNVGNDFQFDRASYHVMAIMRSMGFSQEQINSVFGVKPRADAEAAYQRALNDTTFDDDGDVVSNAAAPRLSEQEVKDLEHLLRMSKKGEKEDGYASTRGVYDPNTNTIAVFNARQGTANTAGAGREEGMHWVFNVARAVANSEFIPSGEIAERLNEQNELKYGSNYKLSLDPHTGSEILVPDPEGHNPGIIMPVAMAQRLNNSIRGIIRARRGSKYNITPREVEETLIDAYNRWAANARSVPRGIATDLTAMTNIMNNQLAKPQADSLLNKDVLPQTSQKGLKSGIESAFAPKPVANLMYAANKLYKAINTAKTKDELGRALQEVLRENPNIPFELVTPAIVENAINTPETEFPLWTMQLLAERVKDNIRERAINMAIEEADKGSSFNPDATSDADYTEKEMPLLFSRDKKPIEQPYLTNYDIKARNAATKKMFSWTGIKKAAKDIAEDISHAAKALSKELGAIIQETSYEHTLRMFQNQRIIDRLNDLWYNHDKRAKEGKGGTVITVQKAQKFLDIIGTMGEGNLPNGKPRPTRADAIAWMREAFDASEEEGKAAARALQALFRAFDNAYKGLTDRGVKLNAIKEFFPRIVNDRDGLAQHLAHPIPGSYLEKQMVLLKKQGMSDVDIINAINKSFRKNGGDNETEMFHHRIFKDVTGDMWKYYDKPFDAALKYLDSASRTMMMRDLFGDIQYDEVAKGSVNGNKVEINIPDMKKAKWGYTGRVGTTLLALQRGHLGEYDSKDLENFVVRMRELQKRHGDDPENFWATIKALQGVFALGTFKSTLNQYLELVPTLYRYGLTDVAAAVRELLNNKNAVDIAKIGLRPLNESERIPEDQGWFSVLQRKILGFTRFEKADLFMKNIVVNAAFIKAQRVIKNEGVTQEEIDEFNKAFEASFPSNLYPEDVRAQIKQDILDGKITKQTGLFLKNQLALTQPLDSMEIPAGYLGAGPVGKAMYYLSTTQLKQAEYFLTEMTEAAKKAPNKFEATRQVAKRLAKLFLFAALIGVPIEALAAILVFKKPDPARAALYTPLQFFLMNEYMMSQVPKKGLASAAFGQMAPGFKLADDLTTGNLLKSTPIVGAAANNAFGPGADQLTRHNEHLFYEKTNNHKKDSSFRDNLDFFGGDEF